MEKKLLIIKASDDICGDELATIAAQAELFGICAREHIHTVSSPKELAEVLFNGNVYDYIYLCAHADKDGFGTVDRELFISWQEFAILICVSECTNMETIFMLACCRTGYQEVAFRLHQHCQSIQYIFGPRSKVDAQTLVAGAHTFFYNLIHRHEQPDKAARRASEGTGYDFVCHDMFEIEDSPEYDRYLTRFGEAIEDWTNPGAHFIKRFGIDEIQERREEAASALHS